MSTLTQDRPPASERPVTQRWVRWFDTLTVADVPLVGGKNASLGEMRRELGGLGIPVPDGFAITAAAFDDFLDHNALRGRITQLLDGHEGDDVATLEGRSHAIRDLVLAGEIDEEIRDTILESYRQFSGRLGRDDVEVAVRSSATAEDLPTASFAGAHETVLNVRGSAELLQAVRRCYASLYTPRAIRYRDEMGFGQAAVALSVGVQRMLASDAAVSGVAFTLDTESGFRDVVMINAIYGLGENIVQGRVMPDEYFVHKSMLRAGKPAIIGRKPGSKEFRLVFDRATKRHDNRPVPRADRERLCLSDEEVLQLARWAVAIEDHYSRKLGRPTPMDIEFAKDGPDGGLCIVQARPETVHSSKGGPSIRSYQLEGTGNVLVEGLAVGDEIAHGAVHVIRDVSGIGEFRKGEVLVTESTDPDWEPVMRLSAAIVTARGGRTSHAAIVARELGIPAVVGATNALSALENDASVTVSCAEGAVARVYEGTVPFHYEDVDPTKLPATRTRIMLNVADPERAFTLAMLPSDGVGLARMEFIFTNSVRVHPLALTRFDTLPPAERKAVDELTSRYSDKREYFIDTLSTGIARLAGAFWPRPVILRFSDFKTNEYAHLLGGSSFEPTEENPMLGWRGASRYYHKDYREGFLLEVAAVRRVREALGFTTLKVMIPFCRTPAEGQRVLDTMRDGGLVRGANGLEVYVMAEIPSNVILAAEFAALFDGFSIGSNDLTQLVLGVDRDSSRVASLFDERNDAVRRACASLIDEAHRRQRPVGICGQAPSDYPEFAAFLVEHGIESVSLNPDALVRTKRRIADAEKG